MSAPLTLADQDGLKMGSDTPDLIWDDCRTLQNGDLISAVSDVLACFRDASSSFGTVGRLSNDPLQV